jgi:hypothetical protein
LLQLSTSHHAPTAAKINGPTVHIRRPHNGLASLRHVTAKVPLELCLSPAAAPFYNPFNTALEAVVSFNPAPRHTTEIQYG